MSMNTFHLVVTANVHHAAKELIARDNMTQTGHNRGFLPTGKQILIVDQDRVGPAFEDFDLSGFEFLHCTGDQAAMTTILTPLVIT